MTTGQVGKELDTGGTKRPLKYLTYTNLLNCHQHDATVRRPCSIHPKMQAFSGTRMVGILVRK